MCIEDVKIDRDKTVNVYGVTVDSSLVFTIPADNHRTHLTLINNSSGPIRLIPQQLSSIAFGIDPEHPGGFVITIDAREYGRLLTNRFTVNAALGNLITVIDVSLPRE